MKNELSSADRIVLSPSWATASLKTIWLVKQAEDTPVPWAKQVQKSLQACRTKNRMRKTWGNVPSVPDFPLPFVPDFPDFLDTPLPSEFTCSSA